MKQTLGTKRPFGNPVETKQTTLQTKPLSDEEIIAVFESRFYEKSTGRINDEVIAFARAIEERILGK
jgi:hypothetical protein